MRRECSCCGAPFRAGQPDPLARCAFCGALLAVAASGSPAPLEARLRVDTLRARRALASALRGSARSWRPRSIDLVWYPFTRGDGPGHRLVPLAVLPPLLSREWRASGADLVEAGDAPEAGGRRVEPSHGLPADRPMIFYPFHRIVLRRGREHSAAWCDGIDGQLLLPDDLASPPAGAGEGLARWWRGALAAGAAAGVLLPAGPGLLAALAAAAGLVWFAGRQR